MSLQYRDLINKRDQKTFCVENLGVCEWYSNGIKDNMFIAEMTGWKTKRSTETGSAEKEQD